MLKPSIMIILIIDDKQSDLDMVATWVRKAFPEADIVKHLATTVMDAIEAYNEVQPDKVIADLEWTEQGREGLEIAARGIVDLLVSMRTSSDWMLDAGKIGVNTCQKSSLDVGMIQFALR